MSTNSRSRAWVEVDASALRRNLARLISAAPADTALVPMVKADAYGLGALETVRALTSGNDPVRPWGWGVATVGEGCALRDAGVRDDIHVYSPLAPEELAAAHAAGLTPTLSSPHELARWLDVARARPDRPAAFQIELDTGMGRAGALESQWPDWRRALDAAGLRERPPNPLSADPAVAATSQDPAVLAASTLASAAARTGPHAPEVSGPRWIGVFTHMHSADEPGAPEMAAQLERFRTALATLAPPAHVRAHVANSAAALRLADATPMPPGAIRAGLFMYGAPLSPDLPAPEPVVQLRARVTRIVEVPAGTTCGYGATYRARTRERWATLAIGYGDGLPRLLGNRGAVLLGGRRAPIIGRISMDVTVANISEVDGVTLGAIATLIGRDGSEYLPVHEVAEHAQTISYEVFTRLGTRLPRVWHGLDSIEPDAP